jgi:hypothetical protein
MTDVDQPPLGQDQSIERIVSDVAQYPRAAPHHAKRRYEVADRLSITATLRDKRLHSLV